MPLGRASVGAQAGAAAHLHVLLHPLVQLQSSEHLCTIWSWQHGAAVPIFLRAPLPRSVFAEGIDLLSAGLRLVAKGSPPLL